MRVAGDPGRVVTSAAVCGGAGDSLLPDVAALGVDVYVTSDLRHHPALDFVSDHDVALIDMPHASGESLWLNGWARRLEQDCPGPEMGTDRPDQHPQHRSVDHARGHYRGRHPLKATPEQQQLLLQLQQLDSELSRARHRAQVHPLGREVQQLSDELAALQREMVQAQTSAADLQRAVNKSEDELERVRKRLQRDRDMVGQGASARVQRELEHEVASLARRVSDLEDAELEMLGQQEQVSHRVTQLQTLEIELNERLARSREDQQSESAHSSELSQELAGRRAQTVAALQPDLVARYESIRVETPIAAAELSGNQCGGCRLQLPPLEVTELLSAAADEVITCDECGCILVRA